MPVTLTIDKKEHKTEDTRQGLKTAYNTCYKQIWEQLDKVMIDTSLVKEVAQKIVPEPFNWKTNPQKAAKAISSIRSPKATRIIEPRNPDEKEIIRALLAHEILERIQLKTSIEE